MAQVVHLKPDSRGIPGGAGKGSGARAMEAFQQELPAGELASLMARAAQLDPPIPW